MAIQAPNEKPAIQQDRGIGIVGLHPVERRGGIGKLAGAVVEQALAPPHAAEVEAQHREATPLKGVIQVIDDLVIHGAAELRMRVQNERNRRVGAGIVMVAGLDPAGWTADIHFRHEDFDLERRFRCWEEGLEVLAMAGHAAAQNLTLPLRKPIQM